MDYKRLKRLSKDQIILQVNSITKFWNFEGFWVYHYKRVDESVRGIYWFKTYYLFIRADSDNWRNQCGASKEM